MRPRKLEVQGLTSYRERIEVDFSELDLFAIWGPTGSGKSSLVDAITFALFGQVPRVGRNVKELISLGEDRLAVTLEFSSNGKRYRIFRETRRRGTTPPQVELFDEGSGEWLPEDVSRVRDTNAYVEGLLGMDYEAFIRSVLLPQGEFQEFLAGDAASRRRVIDRLLQLEVYGLMHQKANEMAGGAEAEAARIRERLETELRDATPDALKAAKSDLKALEAEAKRLAAERSAAESACREAEAGSAAAARERAARAKLEDATTKLAAGKELLASGEDSLKATDAQIADVQSRVKAANYNADLHLRLNECVALVRQLERETKDIGGLSERAAKASKEVERRKAEDGAARKRYEECQKATVAKHETWEHARRENAAALLRSGLKPGDPCPVCGQKVGVLEKGEAHELDRLRSDWEAARQEEAKTLKSLNDAQRELATAEQAERGLKEQVKSAEENVKRRESELGKALAPTGVVRSDVEKRLEALEKAKAAIVGLDKQEKELRATRDNQANALAQAQGDVTRLAAEAGAHDAEARAASEAASKALGAALATARKMDWEDVLEALEAGRDAGAILSRRLRFAQEDESRVNQEIGATRARIGQIERDIERAKELRKEEETHRKSATLAKDLASLLRTNNFPTYIRESALRALAEGGSQRLNEISGGRYDFDVAGQDFVIVDRWNGGEERSVKTLSGGETFLASLALALALAEQLPGLGGGGEGALESLFIDEGFSNLDNETLDDVASALEVLGQDRKRLIGVITHLSALAERMPARITVHKSGAASTVTVD